MVGSIESPQLAVYREPETTIDKARSGLQPPKTEVHYQAAKAVTPPLPEAAVTPLAPVAAALPPAKEVFGIVPCGDSNGRKAGDIATQHIEILEYFSIVLVFTGTHHLCSDEMEPCLKIELFLVFFS